MEIFMPKDHLSSRLHTFGFTGYTLEDHNGELTIQLDTPDGVTILQIIGPVSAAERASIVTMLKEKQRRK